MKLLAFETATEACSVALHVDGQVLERYEIAPRRPGDAAVSYADPASALAELGWSGQDGQHRCPSCRKEEQL